MLTMHSHREEIMKDLFSLGGHVIGELASWNLTFVDTKLPRTDIRQYVIGGFAQSTFTSGLKPPL